MARVGGLTPFENVGSGGVDRAGGRAAIAPNRPAPDLVPRAQPVSIYSHPEDNTQAAGSDLAQLAQSLSKLNPALTGFLSTGADERKQQMEAAAENKIGGMTFDEAQKGVQDGSIHELQNPWFRAAFMKQFGQRVALRKAQELNDQYANGFNRDGGDVEKLVADTAKPVLDQYGNDKHFSSGFNGVFAPQAAKLRNDQAAYQSSKVNTEVRQGVYEIGTALIGDGMAKGQTADEIVSNIRSTYAGNKQLLNVPYREQDAEVFRMVETLTKGISTSTNPQLQKEIVEKLLNDERVAPDGKNLGPLSKNRDYASKAVVLLDAADKELRQTNQKTSFDAHYSWDQQATNGLISDQKFEELNRWREKNPGAMTDGQALALKHRSDAVLETRRAEVSRLEETQRARALAEGQHNAVIGEAASLAGQGNLWAVKDTEVTDESGNKKKLSADSIRKEVVTNFLRQPTTFDQQVDWFGRQGEENPQWSDLLKRGYIQATAATVSGNKLPQGLEAGIDLYSQLYAKNPSLLSKHVDDSGMNFYEAVRFGTQVAGFDKRTAVINALEVNKDPTKFESQYWKQKFDDISNAVRSTVQGTFFNGAPDNAGEIAPAIEQSAKYFAKLGAPPNVAIEEAKKRVNANYVNVNNYLVRTGDRAVPAAFPDMAKRYIDDYVSKYGEKEGVSTSDLTVQPIGNGAGQWRIVMKKSPGMIVDHPEGIFDMPKLMDAEKARVAKAQADKVESLNKRNAQPALTAPPVTFDVAPQ